MATNKSEVIAGYRLRSLLHSGATSQVYEVVEVTSNRHFAMKILLPEMATEKPHRDVLFYEAEVGSKLAHPHVIKIVRVNKDEKNPFFLMEYFPSGALRTRMDKSTKDKTEADWLKAKMHSILRQAATGLAYMNAKGYIHRDVKPDNILVNSGGEVKIIDYAIAYKPPTGFAKLFYKKSAKAQGTRSYMSPEQIRSEILDPRADVYSFGAMCFELVVGRPPFRGKDAQDLLTKHILEAPVPPGQLNPDVTKEFSEIILKMLSKKREGRPQNFHEVLIALKKMRLFKSQPAVVDEEG